MATSQTIRLFSVYCLLSTTVALLTSGCNKPATNDTPTPEPLTGPSADAVIEKMRTVYRDAKTYSDNATFVQSSVLRSEGVQREIPFHQMSLVYERPNRLRFKFQKVRSNSPGNDEFDIANDGTIVRMHASELPKQVQEAIAPMDLTPENFIPSPEMRRAILEVDVENVYPQLSMLLTADTFFPNDSNPTLLEQKKIDNADCYRVALHSDAGQRILWIEKQSHALRRMELPIKRQLDDLNPRDLYSEMSVWIDYENVQLDADHNDDTFTLAIPEGGRRVRRLIPPPPPGPSPMLGQSISELAFTSLEGQEITSASLANKVVVLDFWFTNCPPCKAQTPTLEKVYQQFKDNPEVAFYAVSTDAPRIPNNVVAETLKSWGGNMPIIRDTGDSGYSRLNVRYTPTMVLLGRDGRLQKFQTGVHQNPEPLTQTIQDLLNGEDLAEKTIAQHQQALEKHEQDLEAATIKDSIIEVEVTRPEVPAQQLPSTIKLEQHWQSTPNTIKQPGDVLTIQDETAKILVLDSATDIVELQSDGTLIARHPLPEHVEQANGFLRTVVDGAGSRWVLASGVGWQNVFVLDDQWQPTLTFPDEPHSGIGDVLLADLAGNGKPIMYVGYWGGLGIHGGDLDGKRLWANRQLNHVLQISPGPPNAENQLTALCTSTRGTVMKLAADGKPIQEMDIAGSALMYAASGQNSDEQAANYCGLAVGKIGQYTAIGFDNTRKILWSYPLPPGEYEHQIPRIQSVSLPGTDVRWQIAAADGSIHWLTATGDLVDQFLVGETLTGLTISQNGQTTLLWVATKNHLTAWAVNP